MIRRSFRIGLRLGLLVGVGIAVIKTVRSRRARSESTIAAPATWEPIRDDPPAYEAALDAPVKQPRDEVGEPILEPAAPEGDPLDVVTVAASETAPPAPPSHQETAKPAKEAPTKKAPAAKKPPPAKKAGAKKAAPAKKAAKAAKKAPASATWVAAEGGACPPTHPVKAKLISQIFRLPGMASYDRMRADRCYRDAASAEADGLTEAKR